MCIILKVWTGKLVKMTYVNNPKSNFLERGRVAKYFILNIDI